MKKIKLLISLLLINFSVYSQTIPTAEQFLNFLKENNYTCNSIDYEEVYSNYGYDVEDDVSELIDAIDSYCKYLIPNYFEEFQKIRTASDNLIKTLKSNDFKYLNYTSLLAFTIFQDIGVVPNEVKIEAADKTKPWYSVYFSKESDGFMGKIPGDNNSYDGVLGDEYPGYSFFQTSHYFSKKLDEFEVGDKSRILAFINSNDELIKQIIYNIYFEKVDDERVWKISDFEKEIICRFGKDEFGKCVDKVDKSNTTIKEDKVDISDPKYVIATNVNIRNKPNVSESKVLFQLNKVVWYKNNLNFGSESDYLQTNWLNFPATPVEIIDSAITDGNKWYKIKGAKLTKEEASDLSKWGDWDKVRDSLFNLDDMGYRIRRDNNGREHWIYHTLVHRFQNDRFKDGKYTASKVVEDWFKEIGEKVNFNIDGNEVKGEIEFYSSLTDGVYCKLYGEKSNDGKHLNLKSTCYSEGTEYEGGTYKITIMDNNAFKLTFTNNNRSSSGFYRYEFVK